MAKWTIPDNDTLFGKEPKENPPLSVGITLGNGTEFGIDKDNDMFFGRISEPLSRIYIGKATVQRFEQIISNMERLKVHLQQEK